MTPELFKELKTAGFPLIDAAEKGRKQHGEVIEGIPWLYPLLSELIEACGEEFSQLTYTPDKQWMATTRYRETSMGVIRNELFGSTPEKAVACLWLALNEK